MADLEKTIRGLECHINGAPYDCPYGGNPDYPCNDPDCENQLMNDAISLLQEQVPKLITLDDFKCSSNLDEHGRLLVWQEVKPGSQVKTWSTWTTITPEYINDLHNVRFWTRKPTKEQSEAVKWDE